MRKRKLSFTYLTTLCRELTTDDISRIIYYPLAPEIRDELSFLIDVNEENRKIKSSNNQGYVSIMKDEKNRYGIFIKKTDSQSLDLYTELIIKIANKLITSKKNFMKLIENEVLDEEKKSTSRKRREETLKRDNYKCQKCNTLDNLRIHHIIPKRKQGMNELTNLKTLCHKCHCDEHIKMRGVSENE